MTSHPLLDPGFTTPDMAALWSVTSRVDAILAFESSLALALADAGLAPRQEAEAVATACAVPLDDPEAAWASTWERGTPLPAIVEIVTGRLSRREERRWIHHGATTQDAVDTAHMIQAAKSLSLLERGMTAIARRLLELMEAHRHQPQMGRTFLQHARPTTFGMRMAMWLGPVLSHIEALRAMGSGLPVQLGGPVGDRAPYGAASQEVVEALATRLQLRSTPLAWHADRSPLWELTGSVDRAVRSLAKIAGDVALLASSDVGELRTRGGGSSSIPDKRNPLDAIKAMAAAEACRGAVAMIDGAPPQQLDRGLGSWHVEWLALPIIFQTASAVCASVEELLDGLEIDAETMRSRAPSGDTSLQGLDEQMNGVATRFREIVGD